MSEKRLDAKNRWRNVVVAFRMSQEEAQELNVKVSLSGLSKQDYIIQCLLKHEIRVVGGMKVAKKVQVHLDTILEELQTLDESYRRIANNKTFDEHPCLFVVLKKPARMNSN